MKNTENLIDLYISLVEKIANGKSKILNFEGEDMSFYRGEIHIIKKIGDSPGIFSSEIARSMGITRAVIHKTLLKLEKRNLIKKEDCEKDKKIKKLFLTEKGLAAAEAHEQYHDEHDKVFFDFLSSLNADKRHIIEQFLIRANEMIEHHF